MATEKSKKLLTPVELEMMQILWSNDGGTVADVIAALPEGRKLAYTSVSTILRILQKKKVLKTEKVGGGHRYLPLLSKDDYEKKSLENLLTNVFDGEPVDLIRCLVESRGLSEKEIQKAKELLQDER